MPNQAEKARAFRALHESKQLFIMPNPWDVGSARVLEGLGFPALATTSFGFAISRGQLDGQPGRDAVLEHAAALSSATSVPVSADLENGFGDAPEAVAETIRLAAASGLAGGSIEDYTGRRDEPMYPTQQAAERVRAAVEAAAALDFPFTITARAENLLRTQKADVRETIQRLQAYQEAGAHVLFAPLIRTREDLRTILSEIDRPLSVLGGLGLTLPISELAELGVRRVSIGGAFSQLAYGALIHAARELKDSGRFSYLPELARAQELGALLKR